MLRDSKQKQREQELANAIAGAGGQPQHTGAGTFEMLVVALWRVCEKKCARRAETESPVVS
jgi:hypothetical protein